MARTVLDGNGMAKTIGELVREFRLKAGLTQADLASRVESGQAAIARLEAGKAGDVTVGRLREIVEAMGFRLAIEVETPRKGRPASAARKE